MNEFKKESQQSLATSGQRLGNWILDFIFRIFIGMIFITLTGLEDLLEGTNTYAFVIIINLLYYIPQEAISGRTLGKRITGTKVVNEDGTELTVGRAIGRTLCRFIPFEPFSFLSSNTPRGWHDSIPKTKVINLSSPSRSIVKSPEVTYPKKDMKHSGVGIASFVISLVSGMLFFMWISINDSAILGFVALVLGIADLVKKEAKKKVFAVLGIIFSSVILLGFIILMLSTGYLSEADKH